MKVIKRTILIILVLTIIGILFRGWFYRHLVTYKSIGYRQNYLIKNDKLIDCIEINVKDKTDLDVKEVIKVGLIITSQQLSFTTTKTEQDPNKLICSKAANCVGYASFFTTTCNYLLKKYNLNHNWTSKLQIGQLYFLGINIHKYFYSPFFKDHDFVTIENKTTGEIIAVDPTLSDYFYIDFVTFSK